MSFPAARGSQASRDALPGRVVVMRPMLDTVRPPTARTPDGLGNRRLRGAPEFRLAMLFHTRQVARLVPVVPEAQRDRPRAGTPA